MESGNRRWLFGGKLWRSRRIGRLVAALALCAGGLSGLAGIARAHDRWIEVEESPSGSGGPAAKVYLLTGEALREAEQRPERRRARLARFELRSGPGAGKAGPQVQDLRGAFREDQQPIAVLEALPPGCGVLVLDTTPAQIELPADRFAAYLLEERLIDVLALRVQLGQEDVPGRERYSRSMKALVRGAGGGRCDGEAALLSAPAGQELEIVPLGSPYARAASGALAVRVLFRGQPLPGRAISAAHRQGGRTTETFQRTDARGEARFTLAAGGDHLIRLIHMVRAPEAGAEFRSYWASLWFREGAP